MAHGGKREGAGKKKGSVASHTADVVELKKKLISAYVKNREAIDKALIEKAKKGEIVAIKELYDRVYGKAAQPIVGDKDNPITVQVVQYGKDSSAV